MRIFFSYWLHPSTLSLPWNKGQHLCRHPKVCSFVAYGNHGQEKVEYRFIHVLIEGVRPPGVRTAGNTVYSHINWGWSDVWQCTLLTVSAVHAANCTMHGVQNPCFVQPAGRNVHYWTIGSRHCQRSSYKPENFTHCTSRFQVSFLDCTLTQWPKNFFFLFLVFIRI